MCVEGGRVGVGGDVDVMGAGVQHAVAEGARDVGDALRTLGWRDTVTQRDTCCVAQGAAWLTCSRVPMSPRPMSHRGST